MELHHEASYKADNGFKAGHSMALEMMLEIKLPRHNIKADPHIDSRLRTLKRHFMQSKRCWISQVVLVGIMKEILWKAMQNSMLNGLRVTHKQKG